MKAVQILEKRLSRLEQHTRLCGFDDTLVDGLLGMRVESNCKKWSMNIDRLWLLDHFKWTEKVFGDEHIWRPTMCSEAPSIDYSEPLKWVVVKMLEYIEEYKDFMLEPSPAVDIYHAIAVADKIELPDRDFVGRSWQMCSYDGPPLEIIVKKTKSTEKVTEISIRLQCDQKPPYIKNNEILEIYLSTMPSFIEPWSMSLNMIRFRKGTRRHSPEAVIDRMGCSIVEKL